MDLKEAQDKAELKCGTCNLPIEGENCNSNCVCQTHIEQGRDLSPVSVNTAPEASSDGNAGALATDQQENTSHDSKDEFGDDLTIVSVIGVGGMGTVYKVHDEILQKDFAVKKLRPELALNKANVLRFTNEIEAAKQFTHTNLVGVYKHGLSKDGSPFFLMECIEGQSLAEMLTGGAKLEIKRAINIFIQICDALAHAHMKGVIHRDLKPSNVLITQSPGGLDSVKVVDFGVSKLFPNAEFRETHDLTRTGDVLGTPFYMSPEQCLGFKTDERSDIYSLGCLMYEALTGTPPFKGENPVQVIAQQLNELPQAFTISQDPEIVKALETVIFKTIEKSPDARYRNMDEVRIELEKLKEGKRTKSLSGLHKRKNPSAGVISLEIAGITLTYLLLSSLLASGFFSIGLPRLAKERQTSIHFDYVNANEITNDFSEAHKHLRDFSSGKDSLDAQSYSSYVANAGYRLEELIRVLNGHPELKNSDTETFVNLCHAEGGDLKRRWKEASSSVENDKATSLDEKLYSSERKLHELASKIHDQTNNWRLILPNRISGGPIASSYDYVVPLQVASFFLWITVLINRLVALNDAWFEARYRKRRETERFSANKQKNWWRG